MNDRTIGIFDLRKLCHDETIRITQHMMQRMLQRGISYAEVTVAIMSGEIIEEYCGDYPFPSCLVLSVAGGKPIHVVCGTNFETLYIVTAYRPDSELWESDLKTRKEKRV